MGVIKRVGSVLGTLVDVRVDKWIGYSHIKSSFSQTSRLIADLFKIERPIRNETFEEAVERLGLSEETVALREQEFFRLSIIFIIIALAVFSYAVYLAYRQAFLSCLIAFLFTLYGLIQALRFHFWYFQVKHRRLGCTLKEWLNGSINASLLSKEDPSE